VILDGFVSTGPTCKIVACMYPRRFYRIIRGKKLGTQVPQDTPAWREEGQRVFSLLCAYADSVQAFYNASEPSSDDPDEVARRNAAEALSVLSPAHDEFHTELNAWIKKRAPGARNTGRNDPTGGGFGALSVSLQDAYKAVVLAHLSLLGLTIYATRVEADGRNEEVAEANGLAVDWYDAAMTVANSVVTTGEPAGTRFMATYFDHVPRRHEAAEKAYNSLQPYLNGLAPTSPR